MLIIDGNVKDKAYTDLILYSLLRCDAFSFALPDFYTKISDGSRSSEFIKYKQDLEWKLETLHPYIIKEYVDSEYCGSSKDNYSENKIFLLNEQTAGFLMATDGLFSWKFPDDLEDLCLYSRGKCWLKSVSHENLCWIFMESDIEKEILSKIIGLSFVESNSCEAPINEYQVTIAEMEQLQALEKDNRQLKELLGNLMLDNYRLGQNNLD